MRLIDACALQEEYKARHSGKRLLLIDVAPTVDAVPVRRGKWIIYVVSPFDGEDVKCSECGQRGCAPYWDYCPHCGARMEEVCNEVV